MNGNTSYFLLIALALIVVLSYFFNLISRKTNIPSVLLLIVTGILINYGTDYYDLISIDLFPILELLGITGLIMIVLEAALDLKLERKKWPLFWRSFLIALLGLVGTTFLIALILNYFLDAALKDTLLYAIPMAILSSAIVLPSVENLGEEKKEFMIYESTFSDILGIMLFYLLLEETGGKDGGNFFIELSLNVGLTVGISLVAAYLLIFVFQNISSKVKLFLLISVLVLLYSAGKLMHLSSLLIILVFGLVLNNYSLFFRGKLKKLAKPLSVRRILIDFRLVTIESAFIVRTFFFVVFGATIVLSDLISLKVFIQSFLIIAVIYVLRWLLFRIIVGKDIRPQIFIAPRGLITILLFFAIPPSRQLMTFENGVLLYVIIVSSILMTWSLVSDKKRAFYDDSIFDPDPGILSSRFSDNSISRPESSTEEKPE